MNNIKNLFGKIITKENRWIVLGAIIIGLVFGLFLSSGAVNNSDKSNVTTLKDSAVHDHSKQQIWTCSMHPQIRSNKSGKCPICGMDLIPVSSEEEKVGFNRLKMSENAIKLAEIQTLPVERREVKREIRLSGKVALNETNVANITARIPGRIDNIYVNYTGIKIRKGERMVNFYSPELITAQQELLQSLKSLQISRTPELRKIALETVKASREKLVLWGLTKRQVQDFEKRGNTVHHMIIYSPMDGIVIKKDAFEGLYVKTGTKLYTIADLSDLWVNLDAYESDISWIKPDQNVEFETESYPGEIFKGKVTFIDPVIDPVTRTVKVRVDVSNHDLKLKPDMFVRAIIHAGIGNSNQSENSNSQLVIPVSSPLVTGKRAVVYVSVPGKKGVFEGRNITLGPRTDEYYIVKKGLKEGELVVVNGAFKIDSDLQIQAKPSMMNPQGGGPSPVHNHGDSKTNKTQPKIHSTDKINSKVISNIPIPDKFKESIDLLSENYFSIKESLSSDKFANAIKLGNKFLKNLKKIDMNILKGNSHKIWMDLADNLKQEIIDYTGKQDIESARVSFAAFSDSVGKMIKKFGSKNKKIFRFHCPMALEGKGAYWLQKDKETRNPFFGSAMLTCQDSIEELITEKENK